MFYFTDVRDELAKKHPKEGITEIAKRIGAAWTALSKEDREPYENQAAKDKARYKKETQAYKRATGDD